MKSEHFPWEHYDTAVYWTLPDDGALFKCADCQERKAHNKVYLTQIPMNDARKVLCKDCIDTEWLKLAKNLGEFK